MGTPQATSAITSLSNGPTHCVTDKMGLADAELRAQGNRVTGEHDQPIRTIEKAALSAATVIGAEL